VEKNKPVSYRDIGFTSFFKRSIADSGTRLARTLRDIQPSSTELNLDDTNVSGSLGDVLKVGLVELDGKTGRVQVVTQEGEVTGYFGNCRGS